ncbi:MAG: DUF3187 family protein [Thermoanaerobaculia bacterium]
MTLRQTLLPLLLAGFLATPVARAAKLSASSTDDVPATTAPGSSRDASPEPAAAPAPASAPQPVTDVAAPPPAHDRFETLGLMRVRDMTVFGISRLDMLPAHAVTASKGTWAFETTLSYQNTWALSDNVHRYLRLRGTERGEIGANDVAAILALPGEAFLVDCKIGLLDLTLHYRASKHVGVYATIPYFAFGNGFLDSTIEGFHEGIGISNAGRNYAPRNRFLAIIDLKHQQTVVDRAPKNEFGDPVFGFRYEVFPKPDKLNVVIEAAAKVVLDDSQRLVSTGHDDVGLQVSVQRFFRRNALYLTVSGVYFSSPDDGFARDQWLPTFLLGWETRASQHLNFIAQGYVSRSTVQETDLDELSAEKIQATAGLQWLYMGNVLRFGITENIANFNNTPDIGVSLSLARILFREPPSSSAR